MLKARLLLWFLILYVEVAMEPDLVKGALSVENHLPLEIRIPGPCIALL